MMNQPQNPMMQGLAQGMSQQEEPMNEMGGESPVASILQAAIQLHEQHLSGGVPPTPESQMELMNMLREALDLSSEGSQVGSGF